ncbi:MAG: hypothetical protein U0271_39040 [Polyangiaceae bacterium]
MVSMVILAAACGDDAGAGGGGGAAPTADRIQVSRPNHELETFTNAHFLCALLTPNPPDGTGSLECIHGDPSPGNTGVHLSLAVADTVTEGATGTVLTRGVDFEVTGLEGGFEGSIWGASGSVDYWEGDLTLTLGEPVGEGRDGVFDGGLETTDVAEAQITPIRVDFDEVEAALP